MITQEIANQLLDYKNGILYWKVCRSGNAKKGMKTGTVSASGYLVTVINRKSYLNHRVIYLMHYGYLPEFLDHIDGDRLNNETDNLRPATRIQNSRNRKLGRDNKSGIKGVSWKKPINKWVAQLSHKHKVLYLGCFENKHDAAKVVAEARDRLHGKFANHG